MIRRRVSQPLRKNKLPGTNILKYLRMSYLTYQQPTIKVMTMKSWCLVTHCWRALMGVTTLTSWALSKVKSFWKALAKVCPGSWSINLTKSACRPSIHQMTVDGCDWTRCTIVRRYLGLATTACSSFSLRINSIQCLRPRTVPRDSKTASTNTNPLKFCQKSSQLMTVS